MIKNYIIMLIILEKMRVDKSSSVVKMLESKKKKMVTHNTVKVEKVI